MSDSNLPQDVPVLQDVIRPGHLDPAANTANTVTPNESKSDSAAAVSSTAANAHTQPQAQVETALPQKVVQPDPILVQEQLLTPAQRQQLGQELEFVIQRRLEKSLQKIARQVTTELKAHVDKRLTEWLEKAPQRRGKITPKFNHS